MTIEDKIIRLTSRLDAIAAKNDDEFRYIVEIIPRNVKNFRFVFEAEEIMDRHILVRGTGESIEIALEKAEKQIPNFLKSWKYEE
jgi:hypothetical protein